MEKTMDDVKNVFSLAIGLRYIFPFAIGLSVIFGVCAGFIITDIYAVYSELMPYEDLWSSLGVVDRIRLISLPAYLFLTLWYARGAYLDR